MNRDENGKLGCPLMGTEQQPRWKWEKADVTMETEPRIWTIPRPVSTATYGSIFRPGFGFIISVTPTKS